MELLAASLRYKIRHKRSRKWVSEGLKLKGPEKVWLKLAYARNAISQAIDNTVDGRRVRRADYEIVMFELTEVGVVHDLD